MLTFNACHHVIGAGEELFVELSPAPYGERSLPRPSEEVGGHLPIDHLFSFAHFARPLSKPAPGHSV